MLVAWNGYFWVTDDIEEALSLLDCSLLITKVTVA